MPIQQRNPGLVEPLKSDLLPQDEFFRDGVQLLAALYGMNAEGGGMRRFAWSADWPLIDTAFGTFALLTATMTEANFAATSNGGPYASFDGVADGLMVPDSGWQEPTSYTYLVWAWVNATAFGAVNRPIICKFDTNAMRSWMLFWNATGTAFNFLCNQTGAGGAANVSVVSSYTETTGVWYFIAGYFQPSTLQRIFVGSSTDTALTIDSLAVGIPATLFDGAENFSIGNNWNAGVGLDFWSGKIGICGGRSNVPAATINGHVTRLFHITRRLYQ